MTDASFLGPAESLPHPSASVTFPMAAPPVVLPQAVVSSNDETVYRCYRYALCLTPVQSRLLARASDQARRAWNELCALLDWAEREQQFGRREVLLHAYGRLLDQKKRAGKAITKAHRLMERHKLPYLDAAYAFAATSGWRMYAAG